MYVELYKKYRPETWEGLIGQERVARSLQAAVMKDALPTAYGFFGPRGTGKTSSAMLLAKSINCLDPQPQGNPCNRCDVCLAIDSGVQLGVNYESMANKGSVAEVRDLLQAARLSQPVNRSIWILDEVHNLSKAAFDALLIPIEDRSMPSLFIFCSTEVDKIPATILSRIQSRTFSLVAHDPMRAYLGTIMDKEGLTPDPEQLEEAIRQGRGSVRDTLTFLEAILTTGDMATPLGVDLLEALGQRNLGACLQAVASAHNEGHDGRDLAEQLFSDLRDLLLLLAGVDRSQVTPPPVRDIRATAQGLLGRRGVETVAHEVGESLRSMTLGADSRIHLEIALVNSMAKLNQLQRAMEAAPKQG